MMEPNLFPFDQRILVTVFAISGFTVLVYLYYVYFVKGRD